MQVPKSDAAGGANITSLGYFSRQSVISLLLICTRASSYYSEQPIFVIIFIYFQVCHIISVDSLLFHYSSAHQLPLISCNYQYLSLYSYIFKLGHFKIVPGLMRLFVKIFMSFTSWLRWYFQLFQPVSLFICTQNYLSSSSKFTKFSINKSYCIFRVLKAFFPTKSIYSFHQTSSE